MPSLPARRPKTAITHLADSVLPQADSAPEGSQLELHIVIDDRNLKARDFAAFALIIDHVYGRTRSPALRSYALRHHDHLEFTEIRRGSWDLIVQGILDTARTWDWIVVLWLVLKYLPSLVQSSTTAYNQTQQGLLARERRRHLRNEMRNDPELALVPDERKTDLARHIDHITEPDRKLFAQVRRFVAKSFRGVYIRVKTDDSRPHDPN